MSNATKSDSKKAPLCLIDPVFTEQVARVLAIGENKYGKSNWHGLTTERLLSAVKRHVLEIEKGNDHDEETNEPHAAHAASGLMFIEWLRRNRPEQDDRRWNTPVPGVRGDTRGQECCGGLHSEPGSEIRLDLPEVHQTSAPQQTTARSYTQGTVADSQRLITAWADKTFPDRTIQEAITKLKKETAELEVSGHLDAGEFADVAILLFDIAHLQGIDLSRAIENKMRINESRSWQKLEDGTHQHVNRGPEENTDRKQIASLCLPPSEFQCPQCGQLFPTEKDYSWHYRSAHGRSKPNLGLELVESRRPIYTMHRIGVPYSMDVIFIGESAIEWMVRKVLTGETDSIMKSDWKIGASREQS